VLLGQHGTTRHDGSRAPTLGLQVMVGAPVPPVAVVLPLLVDVQQREVVRLRHKKLLACRVALLRPLRRPACNCIVTTLCPLLLYLHTARSLHR